jgi:lysophospholipase L1-like esterase
VPGAFALRIECASMKQTLLAVMAVAVLALTALAALTIADWKAEADFAQSVYAEVRRRPPHPFLQVLPGGQVGHVNDEGFRGDALAAAKPAHALRIFTLGGSTTLGVTNSYEDSYPYLLQQLLRARHPGHDIEVQNAAAAWYTTAHNVVSYDLLVRRFHPDVVIFFEAINDLVRSFSPPWFARGDFKPDYSHYLGPYARFSGPDVEFPSPPSSWLEQRLVWRMAKRRFTHEPTPLNQRDPDNVARLAASMQPIDAVAFRSVDSFREYYETLIRRVTADGATFIAASQPFVYSSTVPEAQRPALYFAPIFCADHGRYPSMAAMIRGMTQFNDTARSVADAQRVPFVDFESAVPKTAEYFSDDVHLRVAGNRLLAERAADMIDRLGLIEK